MIRIAILAILGLGAASAFAENRVAAPLRCEDEGVARELAFPARGLLMVPIEPDGLSPMPVLVIEERGSDLDWRLADTDAFQSIAVRPLRYGYLALPIDRAQVLSLQASANYHGEGRARARLICAPDLAVTALPACVALANSTETSASVFENLLAGSSELCHALLVHRRAYAASKQAKPSLSHPLFVEADALWAHMNDAPRQAAALLGITEQATRMSRYPEALEAAQQAEEVARIGGSPYYQARALSQRCLAHQYLGETGLAWACLRTVPAMFMRIGELNEAANAWFSLGAFASDNGARTEADHALLEVARLDQSTISVVVNGRLNSLRARLATEDGRVDEALTFLRDALVAFEADGNPRWQGNMFLRIAELYFQMGALNEAGDFVDSAIARFPESEAPARLAEALMLRAKLAQEQARPDEAKASLDRARALYVAAGMPLKVIEAGAYASELEMSPESATDLQALLKGQSNITPRLRGVLDLASARRAARERDWSSVASILGRMKISAMGLSQSLQHTMIQASLLNATGKGEKSFQILEQAMTRLRAAAARAKSPALRHIAGRRLLDLRRSWIDVYLSMDARRRPSADTVWRVIQLAQVATLLRSVSEPTGPHQGQSAIEFDRALATELLPGSDEEAAEPAARRLLLNVYADAEQGAALSTPELRTTTQIQSEIGSGDLFLSIALGTERGLALSISSNVVGIHELGETKLIRRRLVDLLEGLATPTTPVADIVHNADHLSDLILPREVVPPTGRLLLMLDETMAALPLATLRWPGDNQFLVDRAASSFLSAPPRPATGKLPTTIKVLVASLVDQESSVLPVLLGADHEPSMIRKALPTSLAGIAGSDRLGRHTLQDALNTDGAWLHIAAHGTSHAQRQGYAGLWFSSATGEASPEFISWIDLIGQPLSADLVVLNACRLGGASDRRVGAGASFAQSLSSAGVQHIVAALWEVSDGSAGIWIPEFYGALLDGRAPDPARGVRAAQLRLMRSRAYRHPFYWASLAHFQN